MYIDILYAGILQAQRPASVVLVLLLAVAFILFCSYSELDDDSQTKVNKIAFKLGLVITVLGIVTLVPSPKELLKVRIGLIGYQLTSPENVKKTGSELNRLLKKLECKHLGCEEKQ